MANVQPHLKPSLHHRFRNTLKQLSSLIFIASLGRRRGYSTYICLANIMLRRTEASSQVHGVKPINIPSRYMFFCVCANQSHWSNLPVTRVSCVCAPSLLNNPGGGDFFLRSAPLSSPPFRPFVFAGDTSAFCIFIIPATRCLSQWDWERERETLRDGSLNRAAARWSGAEK